MKININIKNVPNLEVIKIIINFIVRIFKKTTQLKKKSLINNRYLYELINN